MARKKRAKSRTKRKATSKRSSKKSSRLTFGKKKVEIVFRNLILFAMLFLVSFLLYGVSTSEFAINLFGISSIVLGFIALAFLITYLIIFFYRNFKKK